MNLHDLTEPVRAILEGVGLKNDSRAWYFCEPGFSIRIMLDQHAAARIAESILSRHLEDRGDLTTGRMEGEKPPWYCTTYAVGCPLEFSGNTKLHTLIAASAALAKEGG